MPRFLDVSDTSAAREYLGGNCNTVFNVSDYGATGDGVTNDGTAIAAAITAAKAAGGGIVFLPAGTYLITATLTVDGNNITIQGAGRSATIIKTVGNHLILSGLNASGLEVRDLQVLGDADAAKTNQRGIQWTGVTDGLIDNVWAKNTAYDGILLLSGCLNCTVSNCRVTGVGDDGINIGGDPVAATTGNTVTGCVISGATNVGIHISDRSSFSSVTGNTITGCDKGIDTYNAGVYSGLGNNSIVGNTVNGCTTYGIYIFNSSRNVVAGNNVEGGGTGIYLVSSSECSVTGNVVTNPSTYSIRANPNCTDVVIADNKIVGATARAFIESPRTQFTGNNMRGSAGSVLLAAAADSSVVSNNVITNGTGNDIECNAAECIISGNRIESAGTKCIVTVGASPRCVISGNMLSGGARGIEVSNTDCLISGNSMTGQTVLGIYSYSARAQIVGNHLVSTQVGINLFGATDTLIQGNVTVTTVGSNSITENNTSTGTILCDNRLDKAASLLGTTPVQITLTPTTTYTPTNVSTDRAFDANATTVEELADVLGTLIADLKTKGIVAS